MQSTSETTPAVIMVSFINKNIGTISRFQNLHELKKKKTSFYEGL